MKPQDLAVQLIGEWTDWNQSDTDCFYFSPAYYNGVKYSGADIHFSKGVVQFYDDNYKPCLTLAIKAELVPIDS